MFLTQKEKDAVASIIEKIIASADEGGGNLGMYLVDSLGATLPEVVLAVRNQMASSGAPVMGDEASYAVVIGVAQAALEVMKKMLPDNSKFLASLAYKKGLRGIKVVKVYHEGVKN